jgi:galactose oxidase
LQTENVIASKVLWIRLGSVTHAFSHGQRLNYLRFAQNGGVISATAPASANLAPPGFYLLFVLNANKVPSQGQIIQIQ